VKTLHLPVNPERPDVVVLRQAARLLAAGELVAFPTETVYGLGADARNDEAVVGIFAAKGRPSDNPLIVHVASAEGLERIGRQVGSLAWRLAERFWPGPLAIVVEAAPGLAPRVTAGLSTVAVRVPDHPVALGLLRAFDGPVAAPSANRSGRPSPTRAMHVLADLEGRIAAVIDGGPTAVGLESTVVDARGPRVRVLRDGGVTREMLTAALGADAVEPPVPATVADIADQPALAPGMRHQHYAPRCRVVLVEPDEWEQHLARWSAGAAAVGALIRSPTIRPPHMRYVERIAGSVDEYAQRLFAAMLEAEAAGVEVLLVETVPEEGIGRAVMDRLRRAAAGAMRDA
jgi:L-threonylcarbamoyladenylate synthase